MSLDFALIGHSDSWDAAGRVVSALRGNTHPPIPSEELRQILPWIPPRAVCRTVAISSRGDRAKGIYIDSFIPPDRLDVQFMQQNLVRVREAADYAVRQRAAITTLGGFSSILLEGRLNLLPLDKGTAFTTGNTLTVAFIVRGIEKAAALARRDLRQASLLIIGATGDVGSGCARCLGPRVKRLLLSARNQARLQQLASELRSLGIQVDVGADTDRLATEADLVICAASLPAPALLLEALPPHAIVCDAGYPNNLKSGSGPSHAVVFSGGLGHVSGGLEFDPDLLGILNRHPFPNVVHGCLLEAVALAFEKRFEPFSCGRGHITPSRVDEMWNIAQRHGINLPPLFNTEGSIEPQLSALGPPALARNGHV